MVVALGTRHTSRLPSRMEHMHISHASNTIIGWSGTAEAEHVPFPDTHVATLEGTNSKAPYNVGT